MVKIGKTLKKELRSTIKTNIKMFLSIVLIIVLGVGFFVGMKSSGPILKKAMIDYFEEKDYMDIEVTSVIGLSNEEINTLKNKVPEITEIEGGFYKDTIVKLTDLDTKKTTDNVIAIHSYNTSKKINKLNIKEGREPLKYNECIADASLRKLGYKIGDKIVLNDEDFKSNELKITGFARSPIYITSEHGTSSLLAGKIEYFLYVNEDNFKNEEDMYNIALIRAKKKYESFTDEYEIYLNDLKKKIEKESIAISEERRKKIYDEKSKEVEEAEKKYYSERAKVEEELKNAKQEIEEAEKQIDIAEEKILSDREIDNFLYNSKLSLTTAKTQLDSSKELLEIMQKLIDNIKSNKVSYSNKNNNINLVSYNKPMFNDYKKMLVPVGYESYFDKAKELVDQANSIAETIKGTIKTIDEAINEKEEQLNDVQNSIEEMITVCNAFNNEDQKSECNNKVDDLIDQKDGLIEQINDLKDQYIGEEALLSYIEEVRTRTEDINNQITSTQEQLDETINEIKETEDYCSLLESKLDYKKCEEDLEKLNIQKDEYQSKLESLKNEIPNVEDLVSYVKTIVDVDKISGGVKLPTNEFQKMIEKLKNEYNKNSKKYESNLTSYNYAASNMKIDMSKARDEIIKKKKELSNAKEDYKKKEKEALTNFDKAYNEIVKQKKLVQNLTTNKWYVITRLDNYGYGHYQQDIQRIENISKFFPIIFFLVAALVTSSSITRIVQSEREKIGLMKSLGYNNKQIMYKYIVYAILAAITGCILGIILGSYIFPQVFSIVYSLLYFIPDIKFVIYFKYVIISIILALISTVFVVYQTIKDTLHEEPYYLMMPKEDKAFGTTFLEKKKKLWKALPFIKKITYRNIIRKAYRSFMTIFGIAGCTALILTSFATRDSVKDVIFLQFGKIFDVSSEFYLKDDVTAYEAKEEQERINGLKPIEKTVLGRIEMVEFRQKGKVQSVYNIIPDKITDLNKIVNFKNVRGNSTIKLKNDGVILSNKLAKVLNVNVGDIVTYVDGSNISHNVKVSGITENYVFHYMYMTKEYYKKINDIDSVNNSLFIKYKKGIKDKDIINAINIEKKFSSYVSLIDAKDSYDEIIEKFSIIIFVIIISAGLLAFVVLYSLAQINISERLREIATLKVLGYKSREVNHYINNEMKFLTRIGILVGLVAGYFLAQLVITTCEVDKMMFNHNISYLTYIYAAILTLIFSKIINRLVAKDLKKIDMIEALKVKE